MSFQLASLMIIFIFSGALLTAPVLGISVSVSTGDGSDVATSTSSYSLDDSTSLNEDITLTDGELQKSLQASGTGKNKISQQMTSGSSYLQSSMSSEGSLDISSSGDASAGSASLGVGVAAQGDFSLSGQASQGQAESGQEAGVSYGLISTSQSLSAGQGAVSSQSTVMAGAAGYVGSAALSQQNDMVATGSFLGDGLLSADLGAVAAGTAATSGKASLDGVTYLSEDTFHEISSESLGMRMTGLRDVGGAVGSFDMNVFNREGADNYAYSQAAGTAGGSSSSYRLTGYRWNQNNPQIQLYLNPNDMPSGLTQASARDAIWAAANTWDYAVAQNLFIDTNTVIVDSNKAVTDPFAKGSMDGYNVHGWWNLGGRYLGMSRWWYNTEPIIGGYMPIVESDVWYATDKSWTTDWNTAVNSGISIIDLQSLATHELGHSIGLGDLYSTEIGPGGLPPSDPRTKDFEQVMNAYDAPQRTLGNGDRMGAQKLYGSQWISLGGTLTSNPYIIKDAQNKDHIFVRGPDYCLWDNFDGNWYNLGGTISSDATAVRDKNGYIYVFVVDNNKALWTKRLNPSDMTSMTSGNWKNLGGYITSNPSPVYDGQGSIFTFVRDSNNALFTKRLNTGDMTTGDWKNLGGYITSDPSSVYDGQGSIFTFVRDEKYALWTKRLNVYDMVCGDWKNLGGYVTSNPSSVYDGQGSIFTFVRDEKYALWTKRLNTGDMTLGKWNKLGGYITSDPSSVYDGQGSIFTFVRDSNNALWTKPLNTRDMTSGNWNYLGGYITSNPRAASDSSTGKPIVAVRGGENALWKRVMD